MNFIATTTSIPTRSLIIQRPKRQRPQAQAETRTKMADSFILPVLQCECLEVVDINGARTIVWKDKDGTVYHQDCSVMYPGNPGRSDFYVVA